MCGIAGIFASQRKLLDKEILSCNQILSKLDHRGPDNEGFYQNDQLFLGHKRLSIIDLSDSAKQPMSNEDDTVWLTYNGEIYNFVPLREDLIQKGHTFKSESDSEVILHLYEEYDEKCVDFLEGMFAFALWDDKKQKLFLARDRLGIKPLYYSFEEETQVFMFSSEVLPLKEALGEEGEYDLTAVSHFLQYGAVSSPNTIFSNIKTLTPGHYMTLEGRELKEHPYWSLAKILNKNIKKSPEIKDLKKIIQNVVNKHLVSDVPLAILLSGGMDSSALVAFSASNPDIKLKTLNISFAEKDFDESLYAKQVSEKFNTEHYECLLLEEDILKYFDAFLNHLDQPSVDGLNTFVVTQVAKEQGIKVLLSGLGGDELFGGYSHFKLIHYLNTAKKVLEFCPKGFHPPILNCLTWIARNRNLKGFGRLSYLMDTSFESMYRVYRGVFSKEQIAQLLNCNVDRVQPALSLDANALSSYMDKAVYLEFDRYLQDQLLKDADVMSMAHSIEMRVPFLDHTLIENVLQLNYKYRFDPKVPKKLLYDLVGSELPDKSVFRKKQGFTFPLDQWMRGVLKSRVEQVLLEEGFDFISKKEIEKIWAQFLKGELHWSLPWSLFILNAYCSKKKIGTSI